MLCCHIKLIRCHFTSHDNVAVLQLRCDLQDVFHKSLQPVCCLVILEDNTIMEVHTIRYGLSVLPSSQTRNESKLSMFRTP